MPADAAKLQDAHGFRSNTCSMTSSYHTRISWALFQNSKTADATKSQETRGFRSNQMTGNKFDLILYASKIINLPRQSETSHTSMFKFFDLIYRRHKDH